MTIDKTELRRLASRATRGEGQHVYTNPRDDNNWQANEAWHQAASPAAVLALLDEIEALRATVQTLKFGLGALVAAGWVSQAKVDEALALEPRPEAGG